MSSASPIITTRESHKLVGARSHVASLLIEDLVEGIVLGQFQTVCRCQFAKFGGCVVSRIVFVHVSPPCWNELAAYNPPARAALVGPPSKFECTVGVIVMLC